MVHSGRTQDFCHHRAWTLTNSMPILPDILAPTATCELEQEKRRFMARSRATGWLRAGGEQGETGTRRERGTDFRTHQTQLRLTERKLSKAVPTHPQVPFCSVRDKKTQDWA